MSNFKVGDVCIGQNLVYWPECNGMECVVIGVRHSEPVNFTRTGESGTLPIAYMVRWVAGDISAQPPKTIRLKRPPNKDDAEPRTDFTPGDFDLCPWSPYRVGEASNG